MALAGLSRTNDVSYSSLKTSNRIPEFLKIAYVVKPHGIRGDIFVRPLNPKPNWPYSLKEIFIGNLPDPPLFSIKKYSFHKEGVIFSLIHFSDIHQAKSLRFKPVFLPQKLFKSKKGELIYLAELFSFSVEVLGCGIIGLIQSFHSNQGTDLILVQKKEPFFEILIPFVEPYIKSINFSKRTVLLDLPEDFLKTFI